MERIQEDANDSKLTQSWNPKALIHDKKAVIAYKCTYLSVERPTAAPIVVVTFSSWDGSYLVSVTSQSSSNLVNIDRIL